MPPNIVVNVIYDNHKLLEKLIKDRARFWGVTLDYETYNYLRHEVIELYRKEEHRDKQMRKLWSEVEWTRIERMLAEGSDNRKTST